jgi:DNA polymerase-3 subunit gamma/tau
LIDLIEIDAASNRGIDEIRDLKEKINFAPSRAKMKVYIIDEVHMMTKEAFNALLKTLEEPPSYVYFILATTEVHKIPETIISRCQRFDFKRIDDKALMTRLSFIAQLEDIKAEDKAVEAIARHVEGSLRDAIQLLEQLTVDQKLTFEYVSDILGVTDFETLDKLFESILANDTSAALATVQDVYSQGYDLNQFCHDFINIARKRLLDAVNDSDEISSKKYLRIIDVFQRAKENLKTYTIPQLPLEMAVIESTKDFSQVEDVKIKAPEKKAAKKEETKVKEKEEEKKGGLQARAQGSPPASAGVAAVAGVAFTISHVKENWPRITERIEIPACKRSLIDGEPVLVEGNEVTIEFKSNFHRNKVIEHDNRVEVERAFRDVFDIDVKILSRVKEIEINSPINETEDELLEREHAGIQNSNEAADQALEVFGGEIIEEDQ